MPVTNSAGRAVGATIKGVRLTARGGRRTLRWLGRNVGTFRRQGAAGEIGMMRLLDLHAASCAGDTLVTLGLAGTIFFNADVGEARGRVALYLLVTMVPFALLAPLAGPLLDRFRQGRRYALAITMLGRAFLAWLISDYIGGFGLYPAAFGVLALSRAYGVARSAAVPRLLPEGIGLSEAGARASIFGTIAGAAVVPLGVLALKVGPQWPLRISSIIFIAGAVVAMRLPPRADSDPPEVLPRIFQLPGQHTAKVLQGQVVLGVLTGGAVLRGLYGFLALFLAFSIKTGDISTELFGRTLGLGSALALTVGSLGAGSLVATAVGTRLSIRRPLLLQAIGILAVAATAVAAAAIQSLGFVALLCLATSITSGLSKLAVDASIQERIAERVRASAFAHSETMLMLAWVLGGAAGLIPFSGSVGLTLCALSAGIAAVRAVLVAVTLRGDRLNGGHPDAATSDERATVEMPQTIRPAQTLTASPMDPAKTHSRRSRRRARREDQPAQQPSTSTEVITTEIQPRADADQPAYHLYRPSSLDSGGEQT